MEGTVLSGEGRLDDNGRRVPMNVKAGDKVLFAKYSGTEYKVDDIEYLILSEKDILGIIQEVSIKSAYRSRISQQIPSPRQVTTLCLTPEFC
jgi:hypothetical protein